MRHQAVFDTNIVIDYLNGVIEAVRLIDSHETPIISRLTFAEVLVGCNDEQTKERVATLLEQRFLIADTDYETALSAVETRQNRQKDKKRMGLVDAFIYAISKIRDCAVYTRNPRDFRGLPNTIEPYATADLRNQGKVFWADLVVKIQYKP